MKKYVVFGLAAIISLTALAVTTAESEEMNSERMHINEYLAFKNIPANDYLLLFDSTPDSIASGHLAIKANCDQNGNGLVNILLGTAPEMKEIKLDNKNIVNELSSLGKMCLYHIDLPPGHEIITDIAIGNPSDKNVRLGPTASITIYVKSFGEAVEHDSDH